MEPTYTVMGGDGKQYGPVTAEQLRGWVSDGRIGGDTQIWRSDQPSWVAAAALPELGISNIAAAALPLPVHVSVPTENPELEQRVKSGASWFYWIAGFSLINSVLTMTGTGWGFALGLGVTQIIDALAANVGGAATVVGIALNALAAGVLVLFGFFANKRHAWAFIIGMLLLALDSAVTVVFQMWFSLALHAYALFSIFASYRASRALRA